MLNNAQNGAIMDAAAICIFIYLVIFGLQSGARSQLGQTRIDDFSESLCQRCIPESHRQSFGDSVFHVFGKIMNDPVECFVGFRVHSEISRKRRIQHTFMDLLASQQQSIRLIARMMQYFQFANATLFPLSVFRVPTVQFGAFAE